MELLRRYTSRLRQLLGKVGARLRWEAWAVVAFTAAGAALRLWGLGADGLWRDEAQGLFVAAKPFPAGVSGALVADGHPPLFFFLMHFWAKMWGTNEFGIRLLPALLGIATIPLLYLTGRDLFNRYVGVLAAGVGAFLPMHILVSRQARMYTLLPLLALLSIWTLHDATRYNMRRYWLGWVVSSALMMYSHNWGILVFAAENLFVAWHWLMRDRRVSLLGAWMASLGGVGLLYLLWLPTLLEQFRIPGIVMGPWVRSENSPLGHFWRIFNELTSMTWPGSRPLPYMLLLAIGALSFTVSRRRIAVAYEFAPATDLVVLALAFPMAVGIVATSRTQGLIPSYVAMAVFPPLCFLFARALSALRPAYGLMALAVIALLFWYPPLQNLYAKPVSAMREIARHVQDSAGPDDVVILAPDYLATPFNFYFAGEQAQVAFPQPPGRVEEIVWQGWRDRWEHAAEAVQPTLDFLARAVAPNGRIWLIAPIDMYPNDLYFGQIRTLKAELDAQYDLVEHEGRFRQMATEGADVFVYQRR